jgi:hypothetical protein
MRLLTAHKILIAAAIALGMVLMLWGRAHAAQERSATFALVLGAVAVVGGGLYLAKILKRPPIR